MVVVTRDGTAKVRPLAWQNFGISANGGKPFTDKDGRHISLPYVDMEREERLADGSKLKMHQIVGDHRMVKAPCHLGNENCPFTFKV